MATNYTIVVDFPRTRVCEIVILDIRGNEAMVALLPFISMYNLTYTLEGILHNFSTTSIFVNDLIIQDSYRSNMNLSFMHYFPIVKGAYSYLTVISNNELLEKASNIEMRASHRHSFARYVADLMFLAHKKSNNLFILE